MCIYNSYTYVDISRFIIHIFMCVDVNLKVIFLCGCIYIYKSYTCVCMCIYNSYTYVDVSRFIIHIFMCVDVNLKVIFLCGCKYIYKSYTNVYVNLPTIPYGQDVKQGQF